MPKFKKKVSTITRENQSEVKTDKLASNRLAHKSKNYINSVEKKKKPTSGKVSKVNPLLPKKKKPRVYTEKELGITKLNTSIDPEGVKRARGKKGKIFADKDAMMRILYTVTEQVDNRNASKLEKARQLEAIRESKRKDMEAKDKEKSEKLEKKKKEIKSNKGKKSAPDTRKSSSAPAAGGSVASKKKRVAFA